MASEPMLNVLAEKVIQSAVNPRHLTYCPTMDLIALATADEQVHVYRLNGQRVFGVKSKQPSGIVNEIRWKPDGQLLAVAFSNHTLHLTNSHTGKVMHQIDSSTHSASQICCLGWGVNFNDSQIVRKHVKESGGEITLDDVLSKGTKRNISEVLSDLPLDLAFLDVEGTLPKLSSLTVGGTEGHIFNSRATLDTMFQPLLTSLTDSADVLIMGFEDGTVHLSVYNFFEIGSFNLQQVSESLRPSKPLLHCFHPYSTTHPLLVSASSHGKGELYIVPLDLRLMSGAGKFLSLLASKSTQLLNILRYIRQVQEQMYGELQVSQDLPKMFIGNIEKTLQEQCDCTWVHAAYHLVVTGNCYPEVKEWLVDELGERGHKRWDKAATTGYENVQRLTHENLLPALERVSVLVSRLRGLSRFQDSNAAFGLYTQELDEILDTVSCLQLLAHRILISASSELRQFSAFSAWLHQEIEMQTADPTSASVREAAEKDFNINHANTLQYIQGAMMQSKLNVYFNKQAQNDQRAHWNLAAEGRSIYEVYKRESKEPGKTTASHKQLPGLEALITHLDTQCGSVFSRIAETQKRNVRFGTPIPIGSGVPECMDMRMVVEHDETDKFVLYTVLGPTRSEASVRMYRMVFKIENGMSSTLSVEHASIQVSVPVESVQDVRFVDDDTVMLAVLEETSSRLMSIEYRKNSSTSQGLSYTLLLGDHSKGIVEIPDELEDTTAGPDLSNPRHPMERTRHIFPAGDPWAPKRIDINGRKGRRVMCVLAQDRKRYRMYDVDSGPDLKEPSEDIPEEMDNVTLKDAP